MSETRIGLIGAGVIGAFHAETIARTDGFRLAGIVDPAPAARTIAAGNDVRVFPDIRSMIEAGVMDAAIVATPNELHVPAATQLLEAGLPVLVEKPVANTVEEASTLVDIQRRTGVPLLVGHHRRHNPIIRAAKAAIDGGAIGRLVNASVTGMLYKDAPYFDTAWRVTPGVGGPLLINLIHEVDLLRHLFGEIASALAIVSNAERGLEVEDTAAVVLRFAAGGMAAIAISDAAVGPWAWDISAGDNLARFPAHPVQSHLFAGSAGGLSLPDLALWTHEGTPDWRKTLTRSVLTVEPEDCYQAQLRHFGRVIGGMEPSLVPALEGARNLAALAAIRTSAAAGREMPVAAIPVSATARDAPS